MKKIFLFLCFIITQGAQAATFRILNYSGKEIMVQPIWNRGNTHEIVLNNGASTNEYNTGLHRLLKIRWCDNGKMYEVDLENIATPLMVRRDFAILEGGHYQHTFVTGEKFDSGRAEPSTFPCF